MAKRKGHRGHRGGKLKVHGAHLGAKAKHAMHGKAKHTRKRSRKRA